MRDGGRWPGDRRHARDPFDGPMEGGRHEGRGGGRGGRMLGHGGLRLIILELMSERPRHGYEIMKEMEERTGGRYSPSPGVVYPTMSLLEDAGHATVEHGADGKKLYAITAEGRAVLTANAKQLATIRERIERLRQHEDCGPPPPVVRAMENLRMALRLKLKGTAVPPEKIHEIAALIDQAAVAIERA